MLLIQKLGDVHVHEPRPCGEAHTVGDLNAPGREENLARFQARPMSLGVSAEAADEVLHERRSNRVYARFTAGAGPSLAAGASLSPVNYIADMLVVPESEIELTAVRAQGAGGQNVNKVSNAIHLRFDVRASSLPEQVKDRLLRLGDQRITRSGVIVIKSQQHRSLEMNRAEAIARLNALVAAAAHVPKKRRPTRPTFSSKLRRLEGKRRRSSVKALRGKTGLGDS
jgi:ribosome-associated protein